MSSLSVNERDLLQRIDAKEELRPFFFRKVKGLKWFESLADRGYFNPVSIPKPVPANEEGYITIPYWPVIDYLVKTAPELNSNREYAEKFLKILIETTNYAKINGINNYRTWMQFAEIIVQIPHDLIRIDNIDIVDYWLDDKYEHGLVAQIIGEKWLLNLFEKDDTHALEMSNRIIESLYKIVFITNRYNSTDKEEAIFRIDHYHAREISEKIASLAGAKIGLRAIEIIDKQVRKILDRLQNDTWSSLWQPAIEDHEQNKNRNDAINILIQAYRDSVEGFIHVHPIEAVSYVEGMLESDCQIVMRLAIHIINNNYRLFINSIDRLLNAKFFNSNFRHEMWLLLNKNYPQFLGAQRHRVIEIISNITIYNDDGDYNQGASNYYRAIWFSAIKFFGDEEHKLYNECIKITKAEPDHPEFSSYISVRVGGRRSPKALEELQRLSIDELVVELENFEDKGGFDEPGIEGLVKVFKSLVKNEAEKFYLNFHKFLKVDLAYVYEIIEAYRELWTEKKQLPWDEIWGGLFEFCLKVIIQDRFWHPENSKQRESFVANKSWIVNSIGRLVEAGTKSDEHAFTEVLLPKAKELLIYLLKREEGAEYKVGCDAVSISINSPRGTCLEALINLTLRSCRIADKKKNNHLDVWENFQKYFDSELDRSEFENPEYEFATLVSVYLLNFQYMSKQWVLDNLSRIFDQKKYLKWFCATQGYSYIGTVVEEIYCYLKSHGDMLKILDDINQKKEVKDKVIQNIIVAYINDFESVKDMNSLISILIQRNAYEEIIHLIWFMWSLRDQKDQKLKNKIFEIWPLIQQNTDFTTQEGRKVASVLCRWINFVDEIDEEKKLLVLEIVPYSGALYNSYELLKVLSVLSKTQAFKVYEIWMRMLENSTPDYPEEVIRCMLANLVKEGDEGRRKAKEIASKYLKNGIERPSILLSELCTS